MQSNLKFTNRPTAINSLNKDLTTHMEPRLNLCIVLLCSSATTFQMPLDFSAGTFLQTVTVRIKRRDTGPAGRVRQKQYQQTALFTACLIPRGIKGEIHYITPALQYCLVLCWEPNSTEGFPQSSGWHLAC